MLVTSLAFFFLGVLNNSFEIILFSIIVLSVSNVAYSFTKIIENILYLCFNLTFFVFLVGRLVTTTFFGYKKLERGIYGLNFSDQHLALTTVIVLYVSLLSLCAGYSFIRKVASNSSLSKSKVNEPKILLGKVSKILFYLSMIFRLYVVFEMRRVSVVDGYYESFSLFSSSLPHILVIFSEMYDMFYFSYLASYPKKSKIWFPTFLYLLEGVVAASSGRRSILILNLLLVLIYFVIRNNKDDNWIGKKEIIFTFSIFPALMLLMTRIGEMRANFSEKSIDKINIKSSFMEFFYSQGVSVNLIGYTEIYRNYLPKKYYSIGPLFEFFLNSIWRPLKGLPRITTVQTVERATQGYLYSQAITFLIMPESYLKGYGYGSSFVAENFADFGVLGVIIGSFVYGIILYSINKFILSNHFILKVFAFSMARIILFAPRAAYLSFIVSAFSPKKIIAVLVVIVISKSIENFNKIYYFK